MRCFCGSLPTRPGNPMPLKKHQSLWMLSLCLEQGRGFKKNRKKLKYSLVGQEALKKKASLLHRAGGALNGPPRPALRNFRAEGISKKEIPTLPNLRAKSRAKGANGKARLLTRERGRAQAWGA